MISENGNKVAKCIILTKEQNEQIKDVAKKLSLNDSAVIRLAISEWLEERVRKE
jgi:hypothetical protein|nr:MAG TPA: hypothetical protein [Caudoviricetes sp.]